MRSYLAVVCLVLLGCSAYSEPVQVTGQMYPGTGAVTRGTSPALMDTVGQPVVGESSGGGLVLEHGVWHSGPESTYVASVGDLKKIRNYDGLLSIYARPVTAGTDQFGDCFYIDDSNQSSGVRVQSPSASASAGTKVSILGSLSTTTEGERVIQAIAITPCGAGTVDPVTFGNKELGGESLNFDESTGAGQRGVEDGIGLNNVGLLVTTFGKVTIVGSEWFYIDDGLHAHDFSIFNGIRVRCSALGRPQSGQYVFVTGISSIMKVNDRYFRSIRPRIQEDIQIKTE